MKLHKHLIIILFFVIIFCTSSLFTIEFVKYREFIDFNSSVLKYLTGHKSFFVNFLFGVLTSSFVAIIIEIKTYFIEKKLTISRYFLEYEKLITRINDYGSKVKENGIDATIDNKDVLIEVIKNFSEFTYESLSTSFNDISFFVNNKFYTSVSDFTYLIYQIFNEIKKTYEKVTVYENEEVVVKILSKLNRNFIKRRDLKNGETHYVYYNEYLMDYFEKIKNMHYKFNWDAKYIFLKRDIKITILKLKYDIKTGEIPYPIDSKSKVIKIPFFNYKIAFYIIAKINLDDIKNFKK